MGSTSPRRFAHRTALPPSVNDVKCDAGDAAQWEHEKQHLRAALLQSIRCLASISRQLRQAICDVARYDWPAQWPSLFDELLAAASHDVKRLREGSGDASGADAGSADDDELASPTFSSPPLELLHQLLSELQATAPARNQMVFRDTAAKLGPALLTVWHEQTVLFGELLQQHLQSAAQPVMDEDALLTHAACTAALTQAIHSLVVHGYADASSSQEMKTFFPASWDSLTRYLRLRAHVMTASHLSGLTRLELFRLMSKVCLLLLQCIVDSQRANPLGFVSFLPPFLSAFFTLSQPQFAVDSDNEFSFEVFTANVLAMLADVVTTPAYEFQLHQHMMQQQQGGPASPQAAFASSPPPGQFAASPRQQREQVAAQARSAILGAFTPESVGQLASTILSTYLPFRRADMETWKNDPEQFLMAEEAEATLWTSGGLASSAMIRNPDNELGGDDPGEPEEQDEADDDDENEAVAAVKLRVRSAAAHLFWVLLKSFRPVVTPVLLAALSSTGLLPSSEPRAEPLDVLSLEALVHALTIGSVELPEVLQACVPGFSFADWAGSLRPLLEFPCPATFGGRPLAFASPLVAHLPVLARRVVLLLGEWLSAAGTGRPARELRSSICEVVAQLLAAPDLVLARAALTTLGCIMEDFEIEDDEDDDEEQDEAAAAASLQQLLSEQPIVRHQFAICANIFRLMRLSQQMHSRDALFDRIRHIIQVLGCMTAPGVPSVLQEATVMALSSSLAEWWNIALQEEQPDLRGSVLVTMAALVHTLGGHSDVLHGTVLPLLADVFSFAAARPGVPDSSPLMVTPEVDCVVDGALSLWLAVVHSARSFTADLASLLPLAFRLLPHFFRECEPARIHLALQIVHAMWLLAHVDASGSVEQQRQNEQRLLQACGDSVLPFVANAMTALSPPSAASAAASKGCISSDGDDELATEDVRASFSALLQLIATTQPLFLSNGLLLAAGCQTLHGMLQCIERAAPSLDACAGALRSLSAVSASAGNDAVDDGDDDENEESDDADEKALRHHAWRALDLVGSLELGYLVTLSCCHNVLFAAPEAGALVASPAAATAMLRLAITSQRGLAPAQLRMVQVAVCRFFLFSASRSAAHTQEFVHTLPLLIEWLVGVYKKQVASLVEAGDAYHTKPPALQTDAARRQSLEDQQLASLSSQPDGQASNALLDLIAVLRAFGAVADVRGILQSLSPAVLSPEQVAEIMPSLQ